MRPDGTDMNPHGRARIRSARPPANAEEEHLLDKSDNRDVPTVEGSTAPPSSEPPQRQKTAGQGHQASSDALTTMTTGFGVRRIEMHPTAKRTRAFFNVMPVVFVLLIIFVLYSSFVGYHCIPMLQVGIERELRNNSKFSWAIADLVVINVLFALMVTCFILAIFTPAGSISDSQEWLYSPSSKDVSRLPPAAEVKSTGERRHCQWCSKYKPDRAHHCRVCRKCVLKMDHHCPWIYNCVGWGNHKHFLLLVFYSCVATLYVAVRLVPSVSEAVQQPLTPFGKMFLLLFSQTLSVFIGIIVTSFFGFHVALTIRAETTIEYSERKTGQRPIGLFSKGVYGNICDALGSNPLLWLVPIDNREGNGIVFVTENTNLLTGVGTDTTA